MIANKQSSDRLSATVALGGGGARGLAHFGALQAIQASPLVVDRIVGTSIGSLAGALVSYQSRVDEPAARVIEYLQSDAFKQKQEALCGASPPGASNKSSGLLAWYDRIKSYLWTRRLLSRVFSRRSLLPGHSIAPVIADLIPDIDISETEIPLTIVTVDLKSGHTVLLEEGPLRLAVQASMAIPGIFPPVEWEDMLLCDLGVLESLPAQVARTYGSDVVIGVDVGPSLQAVDDCASSLHVLLRMDEIGERICRRLTRSFADILVTPDVGRVEWFDFSHAETLQQAGAISAAKAIRRFMADRFEDPGDTPIIGGRLGKQLSVGIV